MVTAKIKTVGVAEFREKLSDHLLSESTIAITKHGLTVGYYIPTHHPITSDDKRALVDASDKLSALLKQQGLDSEQLITEAQKLRKLESNVR